MNRNYVITGIVLLVILIIAVVTTSLLAARRHRNGKAEKVAATTVAAGRALGHLYAPLARLLPDVCDPFFDETAPKLVALADRLPELFPTGGAPDTLSEGVDRELSLSREQAACLLANAFMGRSPELDFSGLWRYHVTATKREKLKCFINYFRRVCESPPPAGRISVHRKVALAPPDERPDWARLETRFTDMSRDVTVLLTRSSISEHRSDDSTVMRVDFANAYVGGGVLGGGSLQEEIMFCQRPELLLARLLMPTPLTDKEALVVVGAEQFNRTTGYRKTFRWAGDVVERTVLDSRDRPACAVVAVDALCFDKKYDESQYLRANIDRELLKLWTGVRPKELRTTLITGNWGCGDFNGDVDLKLLLQLLVCVREGITMEYLPPDKQDCRRFLNALNLIYDPRRHITAGALYRCLIRYSGPRKNGTLHEYMDQSLPPYTLRHER